MREKQTTTIDSDYGTSHEYECIQHPAGEGFDLLPKITQVFGESFGNILGALEEADASGLSSIDGELVGTAFRKLAENVISVGSHKFLKEILKYTHRVGEGGQKEKVFDEFDRIYQGNYGELAAAVKFALMANYGPFFRSRLGGGLSRAEALFKKKFADLQTAQT